MKKSVKIFFLFPDKNTGLIQPHMGSDYLIAELAKEGYSVERVLSNEGEMLEKTLSPEKINISLDIYPIFCITCYDAAYPFIKIICKKLKTIYKSSSIILGGPTASDNDKLLLFNIAESDCCIKGEGETLLLDVIKRIECEKELSSMNSVSYRDRNGNIVLATKKNFLKEEEMNQYPAPFSSGVVPIDKIIQRYGKVSMITSRGCPNQCNFCAFSIQSDRNVRYYSVDTVINEIVYISEFFKKNRISRKDRVIVIEDDCFTLNKKRVYEILNKLIELRLEVYFECETRADYLDFGILTKMKEAGFRRVDISLESTDCNVLFKCGKVSSLENARIYIEKVKEVISGCETLGMDCYTTLLAGLPNDSLESLEATHKFIVDNNPSGYFWNNLRIYTGTKLSDEITKYIDSDVSEDALNSIWLANTTYSKISPYDPRKKLIYYDDQPAIERQMEIKMDICNILKGHICQSKYIIVNSNFDFKKNLKFLIDNFSFDVRFIISEDDVNNDWIRTFNLAEVYSIAYFKSNSNKDVINTLYCAIPGVKVDKYFFSSLVYISKKRDYVLNEDNLKSFFGKAFYDFMFNEIER